MPISIRRVEVTDLLPMQQTNLKCLPENYSMWFWGMHYLNFKQISTVSIGNDGKLLGYVLGTINDEKTESGVSGHIDSVAVCNKYRKLGLAYTLLDKVHHELVAIYDAYKVSLNVRLFNTTAHKLYYDKFKYKTFKEEQNYYADNESCLILHKFF